MRRTLCLLAFAVIYNAQASLVSQPLGIAGNFLTTTVTIGQPPQNFDLAITLTNDKLTVLDAATQNSKIDYQYDYIKALYFSTVSNTANLTQIICRERYTGPDGKTHSSDGHYIIESISLSGEAYPAQVRFCDLDTPRTEDSINSDPLNWLMKLPIDGFLGLKPGGENVFQHLNPSNPLQLSFYLNDNSNEPDIAGWITFGGKDKEHCGPYLSFPSDDSDSFSTWITGTSFNQVTEHDTYSALFDFTYDGYIVPKDVYNDVAYYFNGNPHSFYCQSYTNPPDLKINIYGTSYTISIKDLIIDTDGDNYCRLKMQVADSADEYDFVLGRYFLSNYCLFLDYENSAIALAEVK